MNRGIVSLAAVIGGFVGFWFVKEWLLNTRHLTIDLSKDESGTLSSHTSPSPIRVKKLQPMKWHVRPDDLLGPDETLQIVFEGVESPLFEGHPQGRRENGKIKIKGRPHLRAKTFPEFTYKYNIVLVVGGVPQHPPVEDPEIQIEHI